MINYYCSFILIIVMCDCVFISAIELELGDSCTTSSGYCSLLDECSPIKEAIKTGYRPSICGFDKKQPIVCCTSDLEMETFLDKKSISAQMCDLYWRTNCPKSAAFLLGGTEAKRNEFPFMALIGYGDHPNIVWRCGGSLISTRYVLSAAHCSNTDDMVEGEMHLLTAMDTPLKYLLLQTTLNARFEMPVNERTSEEQGPARWVRLGEQDTSTDNDTVHEDFMITRIIDHPDYQLPAKYNDIALYRLDRETEISSRIRPICLNQSPDVTRYKTAIATGWGSVGFVGRVSSRLLKVSLDIFHVDQCSKTGSDKRQLPNGIVEDSMICSGKEDGESDTCPGDSGGPLFLPRPEEYRYYACVQLQQIGITSFGYQCGVAGYPGVYTKVSHYLKWIESIVWGPDISNEPPSWTD